MIIKQFRVQNVKSGKIIVMNENSINALKRHHLWKDFDILPEPKPIEQPIVKQIVESTIDDESNIDMTNVDELIVDESNDEQIESKPKRKYKKQS